MYHILLFAGGKLRMFSTEPSISQLMFFNLIYIGPFRNLLDR